MNFFPFPSGAAAALIFMVSLASWRLIPNAEAAANPANFVVVGNPKNPPDDQDGVEFGAVEYEYRIGKFNVTVAEYAEFLNAAAASDPNGLFNENMEITREGEDGSYTYQTQEGKARRPIRWVEAVDGMRYCNWLHNGGLKTSDTESGVYDFADPVVPGPRSANAKYFLPTENEWYKAAYFDPTKDGTGGYWMFAVRSDEVESGLPPGTAQSANFDAVNAEDGGTTDVGAFTSASSYYGTFDQTGNTWEWLEPSPDTPDISRRRSGSWENNIGRLSKTQTGQGGVTTGGTQHQGFRIAAAAAAQAPGRLTIKKTGENVEIAWTGGGQLESSPSATGPWSAVTNASNPHSARPQDSARFYRLR